MRSRHESIVTTVCLSNKQPNMLLKEEQNLLIKMCRDESNDLLKGFSEKHNENNLLTYKHKYLIDEKYEVT